MNGTELALRLLPGRYTDKSVRNSIDCAEELRLRPGQALSMIVRGEEYDLPGGRITEEDLLRTLEKATEASLHTAAPELERGYISYHGLRIGVCGTAVMQHGRFSGFRKYSSLAIRIPREIPGVCRDIITALLKEGGGNVLIISPPGAGKTTALRELIRRFSESGRRVAVVDERGEIAAAESGRPQFQLGPRCDVLTGTPRSSGSMMLLRGMNPEWIAMDEITGKEELEAVREISGCGVRLAATAHARDADDLNSRELYRTMLEEHIFSNLIQITLREGQRCYSWRKLENGSCLDAAR